MRFDDRLATVLNQPADNRRDRAVRWRQLVDLVARSGAEESEAVTRALGEIESGLGDVEEAVRAAAARAVAALPLPIGLIEVFVRDNLTVSAPILAAASLDDPQWRRLADAADVETRRFIETIHPLAADTAQAPAVIEAAPDVEPSAPSVDQQPGGRSLADVVARIERRRRLRESPPLSAGRTTASGQSLFRWECGPSGDIRWVEGAPRGALVGLSIAGSGHGESDIGRAFARRSPFRDAALTIAGDGAVSGEWKVSGVPAFEPSDGRFAGYRGIAMREHPAGEAGIADRGLEQALSDPASLRELVHEIKTPLNAIIGFAEIIDGQYLGPADRLYRDRASQIVGQARLLLGAIDDLDLAARSQAGTGASATRSDLAALVGEMIVDLRIAARERGADLSLSRSAAEALTPLASALAGRILRNFFGAVIAAAAKGDRIAISVERSGRRWRVGITRPATLRAIADEQLFGAAAPSVGTDSAGFSLRLARGLARLAGVTLVSSDRDFALLFPSE